MAPEARQWRISPSRYGLVCAQVAGPPIEIGETVTVYERPPAGEQEPVMPSLSSGEEAGENNAITAALAERRRIVEALKEREIAVRESGAFADGFGRAIDFIERLPIGNEER